LSTVRPYENSEYDPFDGPLIANVGGENGEKFTREVFGQAYVEGEIKYYYDEYQVFIYDETKMVIYSG